MGEWMEAYIDSKNNEPDYNHDIKATTRKCWGFADRKNKCKNIIISIGGVYCDECRRYYESGEWR